MTEIAKDVPPSDHGTSTANANAPRTTIKKPGRFGRLFPELPAWTLGSESADERASESLAAAMHPATGSESNIPAGFTYLGQFIDHDITFDPTSFGENVVDVDDLTNFRTPALDLDCLYGSGPRDQPFLYLRDVNTSSPQFLVGPVLDAGEGSPGQDFPAVRALSNAPYDLPRACDGTSTRTAIIGDKRNDENLIVAQLHRTMAHFHNAVCTEFPNANFDEVRRIVIHHYQKIILGEFLPLITGQLAVDSALEKLNFYLIGPGHVATSPYIPVEFSGAAYRFGHSMVRSSYHFNKVFNDTTFRLAFTFTGDGGFRGLPRYPTNWLLDWRQFFHIDEGVEPQRAMAIDPGLATELRIGQSQTSLALLNLRRGYKHYKLPSGQAIAERMGHPVLSRVELESGIAGDAVREMGVGSSTPLWFYILKEAEVMTKGERLGPVGAQIVAEVFIGLLREDPESVLNNPTSAELPTTGETFKVADLLRFIEAKKGMTNIHSNGVINPLG